MYRKLLPRDDEDNEKAAVRHRTRHGRHTVRTPKLDVQYGEMHSKLT